MRRWHRGFGRNRQFIAIPLSAGRAWGWVLIQHTQQNNKHNTSWGALSQQEGCTMMSSHLCPTVWEWHHSFWTRIWSRGLRVGGANQWGLWCYPPKQKQLIWRKQTAKTNFRWWFSLNSETRTLSHIHKYMLHEGGAAPFSSIQNTQYYWKQTSLKLIIVILIITAMMTSTSKGQTCQQS